MKTTGAAKAAFPALDSFRLVAAFLVVAVHTSPLLSVNAVADFAFAHVLARFAVPFFFMASGFFLVRNQTPLRSFLFKMAKLYAFCILLYLPLNVYRGDFLAPGWPLQALQDLVWNGTMYHLWYFPGTMLGAAIAWLCRRYLCPGACLFLCGFLYLVGLGGDSWYGLACLLPGAQSFYGGLFHVFDYTRNGLFFAPLFVWLGMAAADRQATLTGSKINALGFLVAAGLMLAEALLLRSFGYIRHDSMYLALPAAAWFLFVLLLSVRGAAKPLFRSYATFIYILHPWCIVAVRGFAKLLGVQDILVGISPLFYVLVCLASFCLSYVLARLPKPRWRWPPRKEKKQALRTWRECEESALHHNLSQVRQLLAPGSEVMAVVKDDAYGHGALWVARSLQKQGVKAFAVATLHEGILLRKHGIRGTILVLGYTHPQKARTLWRWRITQTVVDATHARALSAQGVPVHVHLKVDTGMHRLGIPADALAAICDVYALPHLQIDGIFTHLARAGGCSAEDAPFTQRQIAAYYHLLEQLAARGIPVGKTHLQSSYGALFYPHLPCSYVRCGLALYGVYETEEDKDLSPVLLRPVLSLKSTVASVRTVKKGEWVGYGRSHRCESDTRIATVTAGYGDGVPRNTAGGQVLLHGRRAPIIGRVCMDQLFLCVDDIPNAAPGDTVTLIGYDSNLQLSAAQLAGFSGSIANEVLARIGSRVPVVKKASIPTPQADPLALLPLVSPAAACAGPRP